MRCTSTSRMRAFGNRRRPEKARLFLDLAQGDRPRIGLSLPVPARLQPVTRGGRGGGGERARGGVEHEFPTGEVAGGLRAQMGHPTDERAGKARTKATSRSSRASAHLRVQIREQIQRTPPQAGAATLPDPVIAGKRSPFPGPPTAGGLWRTWDGPVRHFPVLTGVASAATTPPPRTGRRLQVFCQTPR